VFWEGRGAPACFIPWRRFPATQPFDSVAAGRLSNAKNQVRYAHPASPMELNWLEDFLALAEHRNFSRAAEARHITQPAFSRRIQALESWIGTPLVVRSPQGVVLNAAGEHLRQQAADLTRDLHQMRRGALKAAGREGAALTIAATHALSFTFFPGWIRSFAPLETLGTLNLVSDTMAACERILLAGDADFLLCHARADVRTGLTPDAFTSLMAGTDRLVPVSAPDASGAARWALPGTPAAPVRLLAYSAASGLDRILKATQQSSGKALSLDPVFTSPLAAALQTMALQGQGMAWLPQTMAAEDLAAGRLVHAGDGFSISMEIRLFRPLRRRSNTAEAFWKAMST
jgi:LysR family transcriptional regulator, hypochlorite-specific transcription factor HypT